MVQKAICVQMRHPGLGVRINKITKANESLGKNRDEFMNYIDRVSIFVASYHGDQKDVKALNGILKLSIEYE